jgi:hypothetical protein
VSEHTVNDLLSAAGIYLTGPELEAITLGHGAIRAEADRMQLVDAARYEVLPLVFRADPPAHRAWDEKSAPA